MKRQVFHFCRSQLGSVSLEFALCFPVFLILMFGALIYAEIFIVGQQVNWAAGELARGAAYGDGPVDRASLFAAARDEVLRTFMFPACASAELQDGERQASVTVTYVFVPQEENPCSVIPFADFLPRPERLLATFRFGVD